MLKNTIYICLVFIGIISIQCKSNATAEGESEEIIDETNVAQQYQISGKVQNAQQPEMLLSEMTFSGSVVRDTIAIGEDGSFSTTGAVEEKLFMLLYIDKTPIPLVVNGGDQIGLTIDATNPDNYVVSGSEDSKILKEVIDVSNHFANELKAFNEKYQSIGRDASDSVKAALQTEYNQIMEDTEDSVFAYVDAKKNAMAAYFAVSFLISRPSDEAVKKIDEDYFEANRNSRYALAHHTRTEAMLKTAIGSIAPDIVLNDPGGTPVALSSLRGKYVLIDFWASWCVPCRQENPNVKKVYNKYKSKGFEIYGVSLDSEQANWQQAIEADGLPWVHVSDLRKWNSKVVGDYNIESIPSTVLLDKEGRIVAKNLRGQALEDKLAEVVN